VGGGVVDVALPGSAGATSAWPYEKNQAITKAKTPSSDQAMRRSR
jgi:hypothetical protein